MSSNLKTTIGGLCAAIGLVLSSADLDGDPNQTTPNERTCRLVGNILGAIGLVVLGKWAADAK